MVSVIPSELYRNDTVYHQFGSDYANLFGCGFLNKTGKACREECNIYKHYGAVLILGGEGIHIDEDGTETRIYPGNLIQRIPDKVQTLLIQPDGKWLEFFICIGKDMYYSLLSMGLLDSRQSILNPGISRALLDGFQELLCHMKTAPPEEINMLIPEALKIILLLHSLHRENNGSSKEREIIRKACAILAEPSSYRVSIKEMAKDLGIGYEKFRKLFKEQTGLPPGNYVMQKRMDVARTRLLDKNKSVKEIAIELGFSDSYAFSKQFKSVTGISPVNYRRVH